MLKLYIRAPQKPIRQSVKIVNLGNSGKKEEKMRFLKTNKKQGKNLPLFSTATTIFN
jgi:hypothetical protein